MEHALKTGIVSVVLFLLSELHVSTKLLALLIVFSKPVHVTIMSLRDSPGEYSDIFLLWSMILVLSLGYSEYHYMRCVMYFVILYLSVYPLNDIVYNKIKAVYEYFYVSPPDSVLSDFLGRFSLFKSPPETTVGHIWYSWYVRAKNYIQAATKTA